MIFHCTNVVPSYVFDHENHRHLGQVSRPICKITQIYFSDALCLLLTRATDILMSWIARDKFYYYSWHKGALTLWNGDRGFYGLKQLLFKAFSEGKQLLLLSFAHWYFVLGPSNGSFWCLEKLQSGMSLIIIQRFPQPAVCIINCLDPNSTVLSVIIKYKIRRKKHISTYTDAFWICSKRIKIKTLYNSTSIHSFSPRCSTPQV